MTTCILLVLALAVSQGPTPTRAVGEGQPPQRQPEGVQTQATAYQRATPDSPLVVQRSAEDRARDAEHRQQESRQKSSSDWWIVGLTGGLLLIALVQGGLFFWQLWMMRSTLKDATVAANAAQKAADATEQSVVLARESGERQLRAYIGVRPTLELSDASTMGRTVYVAKAYLTNRGQTPAYNMLEAVRFEVLGSTLPASLDLQPERSVGILTPGAETELLPPLLALDSSVRNKLSAVDPTDRLYLYGFVVYEDAFKKRWRQRFCYYMDWSRGDGRVGIMTTPDGNDEVCIGGHPGHEGE